MGKICVHRLCQRILSNPLLTDRWCAPSPFIARYTRTTAVIISVLCLIIYQIVNIIIMKLSAFPSILADALTFPISSAFNCASIDQPQNIVALSALAKAISLNHDSLSNIYCVQAFSNGTWGKLSVIKYNNNYMYGIPGSWMCLWHTESAIDVFDGICIDIHNEWNKKSHWLYKYWCIMWVAVIQHIDINDLHFELHSILVE